jgi:peptidyl-prolyl cis-trans isomerase D
MAEPRAEDFWKSVENLVRSDIIKFKLQHLVIQAAVVTEEEVKQAYIDSLEKVKVALVDVSVNQLPNPTSDATDEELRAYYQEHQDDFMQEERVIVNVALVDKEPTEADWERSFRRISLIYDSLQAGADFADLAEFYSEDGSASKGGDLGWFPEGQMVPEFDERSFSMEEGEMSEPFRTRYGWHIIKHHGYRTEEKVPRGKTEKEEVREAHVSHILIKTITTRETLDELHRRMQTFTALAIEKGFEAAGEELDIETKRTTPFTRRGPVQFVGYNVPVQEFAFAAEVNDISDVRSNASSYFVVQIAEKLPAGIAPFEDVEAQVRRALAQEKKAEKAREIAAQIYADIQSGTDMETAAENHSATYVEPEPFTRRSVVPSIGGDPVAIGTAFSLHEPGEISSPTDYSAGTVIFKLLERRAPDLTMFNENRDSLYNTVMFSKQQRLYSRWFQKLMDEAEIDNNIERLSEEPQDI